MPSTRRRVFWPATSEFDMRRSAFRFLTCAAALVFAGCGAQSENFGDPLHNAAYRGDLAVVRDLLETQSVPVDRRTAFGYYTALVLAGYTEHTHIVALLLNNGADVNAQDGMGMSALHCAAYYGRTETARLLIEHGANLTLTNSYGCTPLFEAVRKGPPELVALLLDSGASVGVRDQRGWQPLHAALRSDALAPANRAAIVKALLDHDADPNFLNPGGWEEDSRHDSHLGYRPRGNPNQGNTPLAIARSNGFTSIVDLLKSRGAME